LSFLIAGGYDPANLYVELVRAADGVVLDRQTGDNSEQLARITWDTTRVRGQLVYLEASTRATGSWGHQVGDDEQRPAGDGGGTGIRRAAAETREMVMGDPFRSRMPHECDRLQKGKHC
jgi:hypothetical protein